MSRFRCRRMVDPHLLQSMVWSFVFYACLARSECRLTSRKLETDEKTDGPRVFLTVSSLASHTVEGIITERQIELNWYNAPERMNEDPTSWVGLFAHDPSEGTHDPLEIVPTRNNPDGYYRTKVSLPRFEFQPDELSDKCVDYWIGYVNLNRLVSKSCLRPRPNWMYEMRNVIGNRTLSDLMIPGTHNAGSYEPYRPDRNTPKIRYQICHDEDIYTQLVYGNRFLDLRVMFQHVAGTKEKFWISHNIMRTNNSVRSVLNQVKTFLDNTNEIVIMDFHLFYMGFIESWVEDRHRDLMNIITGTMGSYMMPTSYEYSTTLNQIWDSNRRLRVGYATKHGSVSNLLYPGVFHLWGNKDTRQDLEEFFERNMCRYRYHSLWSAMAELTPTTTGVLIDKYGGVRNMAQDVNLHVTKWFRDRWWNCTNIVATDFFLGNNLIDVSIEANKKRWS